MAKSFSLRSVPVKLPPVERFAQFLQSRGKRLTPAAAADRRAGLQPSRPLRRRRADGALQPLIARRKLSRPTVYRTLAELVEAGMLRKMTSAAAAVYEHEYGYPSHDHLYCQVCNRLIEFHSAELERIRDRWPGSSASRWSATGCSSRAVSRRVPAEKARD